MTEQSPPTIAAARRGTLHEIVGEQFKHRTAWSMMVVVVLDDDGVPFRDDQVFPIDLAEDVWL